MRLLEDPLYQNIKPDLFVLKGVPRAEWYFELNAIIEYLLKPYNARGPGVADKLRGLYYVHYNITSLYWS